MAGSKKGGVSAKGIKDFFAGTRAYEFHLFTEAYLGFLNEMRLIRVLLKKRAVEEEFQSNYFRKLDQLNYKLTISQEGILSNREQLLLDLEIEKLQGELIATKRPSGFFN